MLNDFGKELWLTKCGDTIGKVRITTSNGIQNVNIQNKFVDGDILHVHIVLSGLNTTITKMELLDLDNNVIGVRNDTIKLNIDTDRLFNFSFKLISK